jgi:histidine triad (HIT) family protein
MSETIFSKIIAKQIPAKIEFEDEKCIVIHDIQPAAPVHVLVIPKKAIATLNDLTPGDEALIGHLFLVAGQVMKKLGQTDYRAVFNCGPGAQQSVFHVHLHVLAGRAFTWPPG